MSFRDQDRHREVIRATFKALPRDITYLCLGVTATESPRHPSRLGDDVKLEEYIPGVEWLPEDSTKRKYILGTPKG
jgi:hypothetical protein